MRKKLSVANIFLINLAVSDLVSFQDFIWIELWKFLAQDQNQNYNFNVNQKRHTLFPASLHHGGADHSSIGVYEAMDIWNNYV